jgi:protein TonB
MLHHAHARISLIPCDSLLRIGDAPLDVTMPEEIPDSRIAGRVLATIASGIVSVLLHGSVLAAAIYWHDTDPGAVETSTDAISIELFQTEVLEAVAAAPSLQAAASAASVQSEAGDATESAAASASSVNDLKPVETSEQVAAKEPAVAEAETAHGVEALNGAHEPTDPIGAEQPNNKLAVEKSHEPRRETNEPKRPLKTAKLADPSETREKESPQKKKGSVRSRAAKGSAASPARVSASAGSSVNFAALVRARVAARKPAGGGRRGTVVIAFGVTRAGSLAFASISRSSGDSGLDRSVLSAVRGAGPFPAPPPGANLRFAMPFYFK